MSVTVCTKLRMFDISIILKLSLGPLSFILTLIEYPLFKFVTLTIVGSDNVLCFATISLLEKISPFLVL